MRTPGFDGTRLAGEDGTPQAVAKRCRASGTNPSLSATMLRLEGYARQAANMSARRSSQSEDGSNPSPVGTVAFEEEDTNPTAN